MELMWQVHCVAMALKTSVDSHEGAIACYELKNACNVSYAATLADFLLGSFHLKIECLLPNMAQQQL